MIAPAPPAIPEGSTSAAACDQHHCITCADDGDPMTVLRVDSSRGLALCHGPDGRRVSVETALLEPVRPGERLLVHAGTAIARLGQEERA